MSKPSRFCGSGAAESQELPLVAGTTKPDIELNSSTPVAVSTWVSPAILVVDDCEIVIESIRRVLERGGYEVALASSCHQARGIAMERQFAAYVIDLELPDCRGVDLALWLKSSGHHGETIFHTGHSLDSPAIERAQQVGKVVMKGSGPNVLLKVLRSILEEGTSESFVPSKRSQRANYRIRSKSSRAPRQISNGPAKLGCSIRSTSRTPPR
jgi:DNA-binding NtrC family response regulator